MKRDDPTIERIRESRRVISAKYDHDPKKIVDHYLEFQKKFKTRILQEDDSLKDKHPSSSR